MMVEFECSIDKQIYKKEDYHIYGVSVKDEKGYELSYNKYGNVTIAGTFQDLDFGVNYIVKAEPKEGRYGVTYNVVSISIDKPKTMQEKFMFLQSILTMNQAKTLLSEYPNILEMIRDGEDPDLTKLKGIGVSSWEKIKKKIVENLYLSDLIEYFDNKLTLTMLRNMYNEYHSVENIKKKFIENPYKCLCSINRVGWKKADAIVLKLINTIDFGYDVVNSIQRCYAAFSYVINKNEDDGNTRIKLDDLCKEVFKMIPDSELNVKTIITNKCDTSKIKKDDNKFIVFVVNDTPYVSKKITYNEEKFIADSIKHANDVSNKWLVDTKKYENVLDFQPTDDQKSILEKVCNHNFVVLSGYSGAGKTTSLMLLIKMLDDLRKSYYLMAPTGKASKVMKAYTGKNACTIHRGLMYDGVKFNINENNKLDADIVIVDEFSMVDVDLCYHLLKAIDFDNTKMLIIGDPAQLASVSCGNILHDIIISNKCSMVSLSKIFRYSEGGLMTVATDIRNGKKYLSSSDNSKSFGEKKDFMFVNSEKDSVLENVLKIYKKVLGKTNIENIIVLSPYRKGDLGCENINIYLQRIANPNYGDPDMSSKFGRKIYYIGDLVTQTSNNYKAITIDDFYDGNDEENPILIANGESGVIEKFIENNKFAVINFDGIRVVYDSSDFDNISLGYATTVHKSQGGSYDIVIFITSSTHYFFLDSNLMYVAITRAKKLCFQIGDTKAINHAVKVKKSLERDTNLSYFLL